MAIEVIGMLLITAIAILSSRGWNPRTWSPAERRTRLVLAFVVGLPVALGAVYAASLGAWVLGPDCGMHPTAGVRLRVIAFAVGVAACASTVPVALAGRRRSALLAAALPAIAPIVAALVETSPNTVGWCLF